MNPRLFPARTDMRDPLPPRPLNWQMVTALTAIAIQVAGIIWFASDTHRRVADLERATAPLSSGELPAKIGGIDKGLTDLGRQVQGVQKTQNQILILLSGRPSVRMAPERP